MGRRATRPRYYPSRQGYYVCYRGKQHCLAAGALCPDCVERERDGALPKCPPCSQLRYKADLRFAEIVHLGEAEKAEDNGLLFAVSNRYLAWVKEHRRPATRRLVGYYLGKFCEECGHLRIKQLKPFHVDDWLAKMAVPREVETARGKRVRKWGRTCRLQAISALNACLNWAAKKQMISRNPLAGVIDRPRPVHRTKEALLSEEDHRRMVEESDYQPVYYPSKGGYCLCVGGNSYVLLARGPKDDATLAAARERIAGEKKERGVVEPFALLLRLLHHTGARPGELTHATAADWNTGLGAFVYPAQDEPENEAGFTHKTARKGKDRVVFVSDPELRAVIGRLCKKHPSGPVLRNLYGRPWTDSAVSARLDALKTRLGLNPKITPYSYRHTSITNMMLKGLPWGLIAETHGTSVAMLSKHYGHLDGHAGAMAAFWAQAKAQAGG